MSPALYQLSYLAFELCKISNPAPKVNRRKKKTASELEKIAGGILIQKRK